MPFGLLFYLEFPVLMDDIRSGYEGNYYLNIGRVVYKCGYPVDKNYLTFLMFLYKGAENLMAEAAN
jgi:hypothetical protein